MSLPQLSPKYKQLWKRCVPYLREGRPGDLRHSEETVKLIVEYHGAARIDKRVLIPVAMMHDIGHCVILPEHFQLITGSKKLVNGKLVHMLAGAKIAKDILRRVRYPEAKQKEIVNIIAMHDADQLTGINPRQVYQSTNERLFHDIDRLDRYTAERIASFEKLFPRKQLIALLYKDLRTFTYSDIRSRAKRQLESLLRQP